MTTAAIDWDKATRNGVIGWERIEHIDEMDGLKSVTVEIRGDPKVSGWLGDKHWVYLQLTCYKEEDQWVSVWLAGEDFDHNFQGNEVIRLKFDDEDAYTLTSSGYSYGSTFFIANNWPFTPTEPVATVDKLLNATTLKVELTPFNWAPQIVTFDLTGLAPFVPELRELCNW